MAMEIKNLGLEEYEAQSRSLVYDVMAVGDAMCVDTGTAGKFFMVRDDKLGELVSEML